MLARGLLSHKARGTLKTVTQIAEGEENAFEIVKWWQTHTDSLLPVSQTTFCTIQYCRSPWTHTNSIGYKDLSETLSDNLHRAEKSPF